MKGDAHAVDDLCDLVGVVAPGPGFLLYLGGFHPSPAGHRGDRPRDSASARSDPAGVGVRQTRSMWGWGRVASGAIASSERTKNPRKPSMLIHTYRLLYPDSPHAPEMLW